MEVEGTEAFKLRFKGDTEKKVTKAVSYTHLTLPTNGTV